LSPHVFGDTPLTPFAEQMAGLALAAASQAPLPATATPVVLYGVAGDGATKTPSSETSVVLRITDQGLAPATPSAGTDSTAHLLDYGQARRLKIQDGLTAPLGEIHVTGLLMEIGVVWPGQVDDDPVAKPGFGVAMLLLLDADGAHTVAYREDALFSGDLPASLVDVVPSVVEPIMAGLVKQKPPTPGGRERLVKLAGEPWSRFLLRAYGSASPQSVHSLHAGVGPAKGKPSRYTLGRVFVLGRSTSADHLVLTLRFTRYEGKRYLLEASPLVSVMRTPPA